MLALKGFFLDIIIAKKNQKSKWILSIILEAICTIAETAAKHCAIELTTAWCPVPAEKEMV